MAISGSILYGTRLLRAVALEADGSIPQDPQWLSVVTPQQANIQPVISAGQQQELRGGDRLIAVVNEDDQEIGVDITFQDATLSGPFVALVAGGTWDDTAKEYTPAPLGTPKPKFAAELYVAEYSEGAQHESDVIGYKVFVFSNCTAVIPQLASQDRQFLAPQFTFKARDNTKKGVRFMTWKHVASLPS